MVNSNKPSKMKLKQQKQQQQSEEQVAPSSESQTSQKEQTTNNKPSKTQIEANVVTQPATAQKTQNGQQQTTKSQTQNQNQKNNQQKSQNNSNKNGNPNQKSRNSANNNNNTNSNSSSSNNNASATNKSQTKATQSQSQKSGTSQKSQKSKKQQQQQSNSENDNPKGGKFVKSTSYRNSAHSYGQTVGTSSKKTYNKPQPLAAFNENLPLPREKGNKHNRNNHKNWENQNPHNPQRNADKSFNVSPADMLTAALTKSCAKCQKPTTSNLCELMEQCGNSMTSSFSSGSLGNNLNPKQYRKSKSYVNSSRYSSNGDLAQKSSSASSSSNGSSSSASHRHQYHRSQSDRRSSFDRHFAERNKNFVPIEALARPILASSNIAAVIADTEKMVIIERLGKGRTTYPIMQVSDSLRNIRV